MSNNFLEISMRMAKAMQRMEREGVNLTLQDIELIREFKTMIGQSVPESIEEGTGGLLKNIEIKEGCYLCDNNNKDYEWYGNCIYKNDDGENVLSLITYNWDDSEDDFLSLTLCVDFCPNCGRKL